MPYPALAALGDELKFVLIVSRVGLSQGETTAITVASSAYRKCERCWHYLPSVGEHAEHPTLCARCVDNVFGHGENRAHA